MIPWLPLFVLVAIGTVVSANDAIKHGEAIVEWVRSKGGVFHAKLEFRAMDPNDPSTLGVFAVDDIKQDELVLSVPPDCLITPVRSKSEGPPQVGDRMQANFKGEDKWYSGELTAVNQDGTFDFQYDDGDTEFGIELDRIRDIQQGEYGGSMDCNTVRNLVEEMKLGDESRYAPFVKYLLAQKRGQLPSGWSDAGKALLLEVLGTYQHAQLLPPGSPIGWIEDDWYGVCNGSNDPFDENAALLVVQRGWDEVLIPIYDMLNHRNGRWLNTKCNPIQDIYQGSSVEVRASRDIKAGEEVYGTYNFCEDCGARTETYGTPEIVRDYGFVENYPQRWIFHDHEVAFDIDEIEGSPEGELFVHWYHGKPKGMAIEFLQTQLQRLRELRQTHLSSRLEMVPEYEWHVILEFHQALVTALRHALKDMKVEVDSCGSGEGEGECAVSHRYDELEWKADDLQYSMYTCDTDVSMGFEGYDRIEIPDSPYQEIIFIQDPNNKDVCFDLDDTVQICGSYRPHYHEMVVHYAARFLENIKRVVWVGGGDSMLLHEIIKYPSLELVIGLELDQKVTRHSFKHYGTQPHWDNDKVQWWYGDATKSLLMLPEDYFGTFDMVLVDLSETVMSFLVTKELDVMEALSLLLKPEGIFVKNELYLNKLSKIFDYTIQIHYYDVPVICSQALIMGSNTVDFLYRDPREHGVDNLYLKPLDPTQDKYDIVHDYRRNHTSVQKHCKETAEPEQEPEVQEKSPGILMVVEAENANAKLQPSQKIKDTLEKALKKEGLTVVSSVVSDEGGAVVVVILREGYVTARTWQEHKYCAFDIHLWSSFQSHEGVKKALIAAVGGSSESSSSYRIVAGGMFGVSSWKADEKSRGPRITQLCDRPPATVRDARSDEKTVDAVLDETMKLVQDQDTLVLVLCGNPKEECSSLEVLKENSDVGEVLPLFSCPDLVDGNEFAEGGSQRMFECEKNALKTLREFTKEKKIRSIVVDVNASHAITQIAHKLFSNTFDRYLMVAPNVLVVAPMVNEAEEWRRNFLERFRKDIIMYEPVFRAEVLFNSSDSSLEMGVTSSGDVQFIQHLVDVASSVEKRTGLVSEVRSIQGGFWTYQPNFVPSQFFLPGDYDQSSPLKQWSSQQPLGHQTIFQLEDQGASSNVSVVQVKDDLGRALEGMNDERTDEAKVEQFTGIGDGCVLVALWSGGSAIVMWDGRAHIDINLFTYAESVQVANEFADTFKSQNLSLKIVLRDEQPRGIGRVVNFLRDLEPRSRPHWA